MFLATYWTANPKTDNDNGRVAELFYDYNTYYSKTFSPASEPEIILNFKLGRGSYSELKAKVQDMAIIWSNRMNELYGLSYGEIADIEDWFEQKGRRYGLLREFRENAIC